MNILESAPASAAQVAKSTRRQAKKATTPKVETKTKTAVHLSAEAFRRLGIATVMEGKTQSDLIESLILTGLKHYVVSIRGQSTGSANLDDQVEASRADAA
jgi:hypothetical protein